MSKSTVYLFSNQDAESIEISDKLEQSGYTVHPILAYWEDITAYYEGEFYIGYGDIVFSLN